MMNIIPDYVYEGLIKLCVITVGGLFAGWITHTFFARKAAIVEIEGDVMKKRISIYEELYKMIDLLNNQEVLPIKRINAAQGALQEAGFEIKLSTNYPTLSIMHTAKGFTETYLKLETYISSKRLYIDVEVNEKLLILINYLAIIRRLQVMFEEQIIDGKLPIEDEIITHYEDNLMTELCVLYQEEIESQVTGVLTSLKKAINTPARYKHKKQDNSLKCFEDKGVIMNYLHEFAIFQQRDNVIKIVENSIALAVASKMKKNN